MSDILTVRQPVFDVPTRPLGTSFAPGQQVTTEIRSPQPSQRGGRGIQSIGHAIRLVGRSSFVKWLALAFVASRAGGTGVDNEIAQHAVQRARMCEAIGGRDAGMLFLIGLFSLLDSIFRMPLADVLERDQPRARSARRAARSHGVRSAMH